MAQSDVTPQKTGSLVIFGHSYLAGSTQADSGTPNVYQNVMTSKLAGLLGIHEQNIVNLASAASSITKRAVGFYTTVFGGWSGALAFLYPNNSASMNSSNDVVKSNKTIPGVGAAVFVHGVNDISLGMDGAQIGVTDQTRDILNQRAVRNAYRTILSRLRAGVVFCSQTVAGVITWTGTQVFGGTLANGFGDTTFTGAWSDTASVTQNSGSAYKSTSTNGDSFTLTLPNNFTGGTVAVNMVGTSNGATYIAKGIVTGTSTAIGSGVPGTLTDSGANFPDLTGTVITCGSRTLTVASNTSTVITGTAAWGGGAAPAAGSTYETTTILITANTDFNSLANEVVRIDDEEMLVTSGFGSSTSWVVTRGVNGTTKANHSTSGFASRVIVSDTSSYVNWTGTSSATSATTFTVTIASPGVFTTSSAHGLREGDCIILSTTGALPTGLSTATRYYVSGYGLTTTTFSVSAANFVAAQSSVTGTAASTKNVTGLSVNTNTIAVGQTVTGANIPPGTYVEAIVSSSAFTLSQATTGAVGTMTFASMYVPGTLVNTSGSQSGTHSFTRRTHISGQGTFKEPISVTQRFDLTNADAGKTIIGTFAKHASNSAASLIFDCWWIEAENPPPAVAMNLVDFRSNSTITQHPGRISAMNRTMDRVADEFDNYVQIADAYSVWANKNGTSCAAVVQTGATATYTSTALNDTNPGWSLENDSVGATITANGKTLVVTSNGPAKSGTANVAVTTTNTTLTDTRLTGVGVALTTNAYVGAVVTCNGKTMTVTSNTSNTFTGASWSGGGNPGNGFAWSSSAVIYGSAGWVGGTPTAASTYEATSISFTANNPNFTPVVGQTMSWGGFTSGEVVTVTSVTGTSPNLTLGIRRGQLNTTKTSQVGNFFFPTIWFGDFDLMHTDMVHPNEKGHSVCAELLYRGFQSMPIMKDYQLADINGNWGQYSQQFSMGLVDNQYLYPDCTVAASTSNETIGRQYAVPIYIPKTCILTEIGTYMGTTAMGASGVIRYGIYFPDYTHARPGNLIQDFGTQAATTISSQVTKTGCYQVLRPGWYWVSAVQQVAATGGRWDRISGLNWPNLSNSSPLGAQAADPVGYQRTGITGALTNWTQNDTGYAISYPTGTVGAPRIYIRVRCTQFA